MYKVGIGYYIIIVSFNELFKNYRELLRYKFCKKLHVFWRKFFSPEIMAV